ncbi:MAG: flagellar assembly protein FliH [Burkholderiaceae bacterium]|nr:flagellar assembly protein FliH [Burkholderiaceae bacterium]
MSSSDARRAPRQVPPPAGGQKNAAYTRFIPREELGSFAAWNPAALSGGMPPPSPLRRATDAPAAGGDAASAADVLAAQLRAARQSGYHDGYRDGLVGLDAFKQSYASQVTAQLGALTTAYHAELDALREQLANAVAATAASVARQTVRSELSTRPELIAAVAAEAIDTLLASARHITLRVHPDDEPLVAQGAGEALAARGARLVVDAGMARGGCRVDADIGAVDATLATRWARAAAALGCEQPWEADAR